MSNPYRVLIWVFLFLAAVGAAGWALAAPLLWAFDANPVFNGLILAVLAVGVLVNLRQVLILKPDVAWLAGYERSRGRSDAPRPPRLLLPLANMLAGRNQRGFFDVGDDHAFGPRRGCARASTSRVTLPTTSPDC
jgi:hypothetical protein